MPDTSLEVTVAFQLNGRPEKATVPTSMTLTDLLRERFGLSSVKFSCSRGVCGACTVLVDQQPAASCSLFAFQVDRCEVQTVEALGADGSHPIQRAFAENGGFQCGYCTPGMVLLAKSLLEQNPSPDRETVTEWMSSNVCRCTGYAAIVDSVLAAATRMRTQEAA